MPDLPHIAVTAAAALAVVALTVLVLRHLACTWRAGTVAHELDLVRTLVESGLYMDAQAAHARAERAYRPGMWLSADDVELLALGPMSLLEPTPVRLELERCDPLDLIGTATLPSVVR